MVSPTECFPRPHHIANATVTHLHTIPARGSSKEDGGKAKTDDCQQSLSRLHHTQQLLHNNLTAFEFTYLPTSADSNPHILLKTFTTGGAISGDEKGTKTEGARYAK